MPDSVDRGLARSKQVGKVGVGDCAVFSGDRVYERNQRLVVSDGVEPFPSRHLQRLFLLDGFSHPLDCVAPTVERLLQLAHGHPTLRSSGRKEVQREDGALRVCIFKKIPGEAGAVDFLKGGVSFFFQEACELHE